MSNSNELFPVVRDEIDFETLLAQAMQSLKSYSGQYWTDMAEHDPGITLLEAQGYDVADLAYRQTRPLTDLLTPENPPEGEGLFPPEFGPHQALTCGPITEDDYRRALLDLHSTGTDDGYFFFCNAQLLREPGAERYEYWYDPEYREYSFTQPLTKDDVPVRLTLLGNYHLYLMPSRETQLNPQEARDALDTFLLNNRNLGEAVSKIIWLEPEDFTLQLVIELEDDIGTNSNIAAILADIYQVTENYVIPSVQHVSTAQLQAEGVRSEDIHQGPWLQYGWLPRLPSPIDGTTPAIVNLSGLTTALQAVAGVKGIRHLESLTDNSASSRWQWVAGGAGIYPLLWGSDPLEVLAAGDKVKLLASGDVQLTATREAIAAELDRPALIRNEAKVMPYGRWRDLGRYYPATDFIPPCYKLRVPAVSIQQKQLHQFLLAFEQLLANGCQQLALLPALLAFRREGDVVWGQQWPFKDGSVSDAVHLTYRQALESFLEQHRHDREQELAITGFLLGYFNSLLAPDIFTQRANQFLASQQGFLSRHTELTYHRSNVRIDQVSALQRRIAARLGLGGAEIFDDGTPLDELPFYLVEHRALMPVHPDERYNIPLSPVTPLLELFNNKRYLVLGGEDSWEVSALRKGQLIDILVDYGTSNPLRIRGQMIEYVDIANNSFWLDVEASTQLEHNLDNILSALPSALAWENCDIWLEDMNYPLFYASLQDDLLPNEKRLACSPFPVMVKQDDRLVLEYLVTPGLPQDGEGQQNNQILTVKSVDRIANTLVVAGEEGREFPPAEGTTHYQWYFDNDAASLDRFSLMLSVVFNQNLLLNLTSDPYATEEWVKDIILAEIPSYTGVLIHWKPRWEYRRFASIYRGWQNGGAVLGDRSYDLLYALALGQMPDELLGLGSMYIATEEQKLEVVGEGGNQWNSEVIIREQLFYVPDISNVSLDVLADNAVANGVAYNKVKITIQDMESNPVPDIQVTFEANNGATIGPSAITGVDGGAIMPLTSTTAGICTVSAIVNGIRWQVEVTFTPGEPADSYSSLTATPPSIEADGAQTSTIAWTLKDAHNNAISGWVADVSFDVSPSDGIILASVTEDPEISGCYTTQLSGVLATAVTVTIRPMLNGQVTGNLSTTVSLTPAPPQDMTGNADVNGYTFGLTEGFPQTGFLGAEFQLLINGDISNNSNYTWSRDQSWLTVDINGRVSFTGTPDSTTREVTVTATPQIPGLAAQRYIITLQKWFTHVTDVSTTLDSPPWQYWVINGNPLVPDSRELSNGALNSPDSATRGVVGNLWSEWGGVSNYSSAEIVSHDNYWSSTFTSGLGNHNQVSLESGDIVCESGGDQQSNYVVYVTLL